MPMQFIGITPWDHLQYRGQLNNYDSQYFLDAKERTSPTPDTAQKIHNSDWLLLGWRTIPKKMIDS